MHRTVLMHLLLVCIVAQSVSGCARFDTQLPAWDQHSLPDKSAQLLAYESIGEGNPLLLIHGFGASRYSWRHIIEPLARTHRVISLDLKGFGEAAKPRDGRYSAYEQARLVRNFIIDQDLKDLNIIAHSMGGAVALVTALYLQEEEPSRINKLVLIDSIAYRQKVPFFIRSLTTPVIGPMALHLLPEKLHVRSLLKKVYFNDALIQEKDVQYYSAQLKARNAKYALLTSARQLFPSDIKDFANQIKQLQLNTLIIHAKEDEIAPLSTAKRLNRDIKNSQLVLLDNVGHAVQEEQPEQLLPLLERFLAQ